MTSFGDVTDRGASSALMPEEYFDSLLGKARQQSAALTLFRRLPVSRAQVRLPVLSALPTAYWVEGDTGNKQTSAAAWDNKYLNIEELAVLLPIPENVLDDVGAGYDIWGEIEPLVAEAMGRALDVAIFDGTNAPGSFPDDITTAATSAGNTSPEGLPADEGGFMGDFDATLALLEKDGYDPSGVVAARSARGKLRAARSTTGEQLDRDRISPKLDEIDGLPLVFPMRGIFPTGARLFVGDWSQFVLGVRKDISLRIFDQAVIHDETGAVVWNSVQQDGVVGRVTFRVGWQVANTINNDQPVEADRYPVAIQTIES